MSSSFQGVGFERLYIKGVLWNLSEFKGPKGDDQESSISGPAGDTGETAGFEFNTINTTSTTFKVTLPDPAAVSYNALYIKSNGSLGAEIPDGGPMQVLDHQSNLVGNLYSNGRPQSMRFSKSGAKWII
jgi:hypothetical protein